ncbi:toxin-antitoxin system HicB family antitoxin [Ochrobactrum sp. MYb29]|uniref:type II toxin-antitoxin system HicB family antitoxin n=1 Tax=Brucella pituitosa TaxID=571256 RepID=UPI000C2769AD|nr:type II toxin-antitoxin system HicB family antitoxin [Brucella pituitosa]PJO48304.1 toxin-antitoxin system HicB family antitoxin [Brucella pituitosa]PRA78327.1 toxin-antitoxin system HicB family antitoxin [Ochrobactrum sp. MYb29]
MRNILEINGEKAVITFDPDIELFRGEFIGMIGGADFYADNVQDLVEEGRKSLTVFFELCREKGIEPHRQFSGRFNVRIDPNDHAAAVAAAADGKSLNEWVAGAIKSAAA